MKRMKTESAYGVKHQMQKQRSAYGPYTFGIPYHWHMKQQPFIYSFNHYPLTKYLRDE